MRLVISDTIEERCLEISNGKVENIAMVLKDESTSKKMGVLTAEDCTTMFTRKKIVLVNKKKRSADSPADGDEEVKVVKAIKAIKAVKAVKALEETVDEEA